MPSPLVKIWPGAKVYADVRLLVEVYILLYLVEFRVTDRAKFGVIVAIL